MPPSFLCRNVEVKRKSSKERAWARTARTAQRPVISRSHTSYVRIVCGNGTRHYVDRDRLFVRRQETRRRDTVRKHDELVAAVARDRRCRASL